jgi:hypothetical protein
MKKGYTGRSVEHGLNAKGIRTKELKIGKYQKGSRTYNILELLYKKGTVKKQDLMEIAYSKEQVEEWKKHGNFGSPFFFGDGILGLKTAKLVENEKHGYYKLTEKGRNLFNKK